MNFMFRPKMGWLLAPLFGLAVTGAEAAPVRMGLLQCTVAPGIGFIITSDKALSCIFRPRHGRPEFYSGTIRRFGLDIGATGQGQFVWGVFSAGRVAHHYALAGEYVGAGAGVTLGGGLTANALVGGNANSISLQPLSVGAQTGLSLSAGVGALRLDPAAPPPGFPG